MDTINPAVTPLRQRMLEDMRMRKLGPRTQVAYIRAVRKLAAYLHRSPDTASVEDLRNFQLHLVDTGTSPMTLNATQTGLRFFFDVTLQRVDLMARMHPVKLPHKVPVVLSVQETTRLIAAATNVKHQAALSVAYGAGLRASEVIGLKVTDVDSERMTLRVEQGKGRKDRYAMLSPVLLQRLRNWWRIANAQGRMRPGGWLFPRLARIAALDSTLHAFTLVCPEAALAQARAADQELRTGRHRGPLHGIPFALKDIIDVEGLPTSANSHVMEGHHAKRDAYLARRLQQAGAVFIGKLNTNEFACGGPPEGCPHPTPINPWDARYVTGGSSSGSAVAVAAGLVPLTIGTDTNGSIRQPAARCGIVGMKPTYGRISRDGIFPLAPSLDHAGPMTRTVTDNALALAAIASFDANDPTSRHMAGAEVGHALDRGVAGLRVGAMRNIHLEDPETDPEQAAAYARTLEGLARAGANIVELRLPEPALYTEVARALMSAEAYSVHEAWLRERGDRYGRHSRTRLLQGALMSAADYLRAQRLRARLSGQFHALLEQVDVVLTTACHDPHPAVDDSAVALKRHLGQALMIFNVTGLPAMVLPVGLSSRRLPLSVQVAGKAFDEATVYRVGRAIEQQVCLPPSPALA